MFYSFNINIFHFNVEAKGRRFIMKLVTLFFRNRHPRPLELVFGRFIQRTNRIFKNRD